MLADGSLELSDASSVEHPDDVARLLVQTGVPPTQLQTPRTRLQHRADQTL
jgi:hypothetical protein